MQNVNKQENVEILPSHERPDHRNQRQSMAVHQQELPRSFPAWFDMEFTEKMRLKWNYRFFLTSNRCTLITDWDPQQNRSKSPNRLTSDFQIARKFSEESWKLCSDKRWSSIRCFSIVWRRSSMSRWPARRAWFRVSCAGDAVESWNCVIFFLLIFFAKLQLQDWFWYLSIITLRRWVGCDFMWRSWY